MMPTQVQLLAIALLAAAAGAARAGQGCPFDDNSCQEYCNQQGCNLGYCGHFAWIQCICRKCGDEWSWYDKVQVNDKQQVNQTEFESLKLNLTAAGAASTSASTSANSSTLTTPSSSSSQAPATSQSQLTLLLVPDLSNERLDMNDIPDENSDKFLDYLAKNHERLVQATSAREDTGKQEEPEELVELQISSNSNHNAPVTQQPATTSTRAPANRQQQQQQQSPVVRLLRMAVVERNSEEID